MKSLTNNRKSYKMTEIRIMDRRTHDNLTDYINRSKAILEHVQILEEVPRKVVKKTPKEVDKIIIDIRKKLNVAEKLVDRCDPSSILSISDVDVSLDRNIDLISVPSYSQLIIDSKNAKQNFINNCTCSKK